MKRLYIASGLGNFQAVLKAQEWFLSHDIHPAFNWAEQYSREITGEIERLKGEQRAYFACAMVQAIREADALLLMMPAKRGSHVEFGVAVGEGKPVVVYNANLADDICFYSLPQVELVTGDLNEAKQRVVDLLDGV